MDTIASTSGTESVIADYHEYLRHVAGLQPSTCSKWIYFARLFLKRRFKGKSDSSPLPIADLTAEALLHFLFEEAKNTHPGRLQSLASGLRSFCRYLCVSGQHTQDLSGALPAVSTRHRVELPSYLTEKQYEATLAQFDRKTLLGKRDYAIALCMGRLGLRAGEVAKLSLDDLDWEGGSLRLIGSKGRHDRQLPLPVAVAQAMIAYLRVAKPKGPSRALFRTKDGSSPLCSKWLSERMGLAVARAGLGRPGKKAHLLRRSFATHLVQGGASLKAVADLLGHADLRTTQVYAKVNLPMLRQVAQPWPKEARP
jgi:site-specific recombinase XerD